MQKASNKKVNIPKITPTLNDWTKLIEDICKAEKAEEIIKLKNIADTWDSLPIDLIESKEDNKITKKWTKNFEKRLSEFNSCSKESIELCSFRDMVFSS